MTKTLTEQWREGTLPKGLYYTRSSSGRKGFSIHTGSESHMFSPYDKMANQTEEVLLPVPSYNEFVQQRDFVKDHQKVLIENMNLKRQLEIAKEALEYYADENNYCQWALDEDGDLPDEAQRALKEMEGVK